MVLSNGFVIVAPAFLMIFHIAVAETERSRQKLDEPSVHAGYDCNAFIIGLYVDLQVNYFFLIIVMPSRMGSMTFSTVGSAATRSLKARMPEV